MLEQITYIEDTYSNLTEKESIISTQTDWIDKNGVKRLEYGFDPHRNENPNTLFFYSWDYTDSNMKYDDFKEKLIKFFENKYKKNVSELKALYVGWEKKDIVSY